MLKLILTEGRHPMNIVVAFLIVFLTSLSAWLLVEESRR
jgi:hypothetical protein